MRFRGDFFLEQDPTVHDPEYKKKIKVTLLLNQPGGLRRYNGQKGSAILPEGGRPLDSFAQRGRCPVNGYLEFMKKYINT